jgi:hypothetical protein
MVSLYGPTTTIKCVFVAGNITGLQRNVTIGMFPKFEVKIRNIIYVRFEVFTAMATENAVFSYVTTCGSCKNRRFGEK